MSNTPLNADDELAVRNILYRQAGQSQIPEKYVDEYIERGNKAMWEFILADRNKQTRTLLNRLNDKIFFSSANPDGQFIKDCIFEELKVVDEAERNKLKEAEL